MQLKGLEFYSAPRAKQRVSQRLTQSLGHSHLEIKFR